MMLNKIEPNLLKSVRLLNINDKLECVLYANNFGKLYNYLRSCFTEVYPVPFIKAFVVKLNYKNIFHLSELNTVKYITEVSRVSALVNVANKILKTDNIIAKQSNFSVAVIDTGIYPHLDFVVPRNRIIKFVDLINNNQVPYDDNGHGTFVSGVIGGNGTINTKYKGIDPSTNLIAIKALDKNGETGASTILSAMQWVYDNRVKYNIRVVCMSFGSVPLGKNDPLKIGAEMLWDSGIVVVSAGGNSGPQSSTIRSPGSSYKIITVGALDDHRVDGEPQYDQFSVAEFSSRGPIDNIYKPDMLTSGVNINGLNNSPNNFYTIMSGTSVSTPMVAGVASIILQNNPSYTPDQVKRTLIKSCTPITGDRNSEGFGWLDGRKLNIF